jgi:transcriptional regulator with XRE-family HTH domain
MVPRPAVARAPERVTGALPGVREPIGALLTRLRLARGLSQLRLAARLCAAAGVPTVSRHEVSRWEREERIPGAFWLGWLAVVLEAPLEELEAAVAVTRRRAGSAPDPTTHHRLWHPPTAAQLLADLDRADAFDVRDLAHLWLAGPVDPPPLPVTLGGFPPADPGAEALADLEARLGELRRMDDLVGGVDLAPRADRQLREAIALTRTVSGAQARRRALRLVAEHAQLAGWVHADAGDPAAARRAYRVGLRAATAAADRPLAAHVLAGLSHLGLATGDPHEALLLARTAHAGAHHHASARGRALLLHRVALAAARAGERRAAHAALAAAERAADRSDPEREPSWLYWLDPAELSAMTGRCLAALGRPLRAARLLTRPRPGAGPRTIALDAGWLARCYLELGEVELAARTAVRGLREAVRAGSARAATGLRYLHPLLLRHRDLPPVRGYERLARSMAGYLPAPAAARPAGAAGRVRCARAGARPRVVGPPDTVAG